MNVRCLDIKPKRPDRDDLDMRRDSHYIKNIEGCWGWKCPSEDLEGNQRGDSQKQWMRTWSCFVWENTMQSKRLNEVVIKLFLAAGTPCCPPLHPSLIEIFYYIEIYRNCCISINNRYTSIIFLPPVACSHGTHFEKPKDRDRRLSVNSPTEKEKAI